MPINSKGRAALSGSGGIQVSIDKKKNPLWICSKAGSIQIKLSILRRYRVESFYCSNFLVGNDPRSRTPG
jgi:hypothetical protein